ncbi:MAG: hypothetical protein ACE5I7_19015 [Candidatus Binatia bacterium]
MISPNGRLVWVIDTASNRVVATIALGNTPPGIAIAAVPNGCGAPPTPTPALPPCAGDCDLDGSVTVTELLMGVNIGLRTTALVRLSGRSRQVTDRRLPLIMAVQRCTSWTTARNAALCLPSTPGPARSR